MNRYIEKHIEQELYDYHKNKKSLEELKEEICNSSPVFEEGMPRGTDTGNPTENKAVKIMTTRDVIWLEKRLKAVESVIEHFKRDREITGIIQHKYFDKKYTDIGVAEQLNISNATYYRKRKSLLLELKRYLGW